MAANGSQATYPPAEVLQAMLTMRGGETEKKTKAHEYLESFQKSTAAWSTTVAILQSEAEADAKLFAATTLRGKITYDLSTQVPSAQFSDVRSQLLSLLKLYAQGPKPIRVQLCVCLAILAIQMTDWKDVLPVVVTTMSDSPESHACILDFLRILPEEVTEGRKITLTEEELSQRTSELLGDNARQVLALLTNYASSSPEAATNPQLLECITSWLREVPVQDIATSPLLNIIFEALENDRSFQAAAECLSTMVRETRDVDDNIETIQILLPRLVALRPKIAKLVEEEDTESFKSLTRVFADAGIAWVVAMSREPTHFMPLVESILECAARDQDRDVIEYTFDFWYELKQYLVLEIYIQGRMQFVDVYSRLVDILLRLLRYPQSDNGNEEDLFDGDREQEEKFREFRHQMGDVLKDSCEVMGVTECLTKVLNAINLWMQQYAAQATSTSVPHWQELEAPIFAVRAMGRMVDKDENVVLPQLMPLLVQIPPHEKLRFATIMVLGRYTEWTAAHPDFLGPQFKYVISSFATDSKEIVRAAAVAVKYFCTDCRHLLGDQVLELLQFYDQTLDQLPQPSQEEMSEGVASVIAAQPRAEVYRLLKMCCDPLMQRLVTKAQNATTEEGKLAVADHLQIITIFIRAVVVLPPIENGEQDPAVKYWQEVFPVLSQVLDGFMDVIPICERVCKCWRSLVISHRTAMTPMLPDMANKLVAGFAASRQGCFLWVTGAILREFSDDRDEIDANITESIYHFFEEQAANVLRFLSDLPPAQLPDVVEDFFRLVIDALLYYPQKLIPSRLFAPIMEAALSVLALEQREPLMVTLHYLRDVLAWGGKNPPSAHQHLDQQLVQQLSFTVKELVRSHGQSLVNRILAGMMLTFPRDCFADGSGALLTMFEIFPEDTTNWVNKTVRMLPDGTVTPVEADKLMAKIRDRLNANDIGDLRQIRSILQDFTNTYRRRFVAPRDGLGLLEAERFRFNG